MNKKMYYAKLGKGCEVRAAPQEGEAAARTVKGYALCFERPTVLFCIDGVDYKEVIDRNALNGCDMADVVFDRGHDMEGKLLARTQNGTLRLQADDNGLAFEADIADTQEGRDSYELIRRGDLSKCSFAAEIAEDSYDRETHTRRILRFKRLADVAVVTFPAYDDTSVTAELRSAFGISTPGLALEASKKKIMLMI